MNIIQSIGRTPLVELEQTAQGLGSKLFLKAEFFNPLASVKDRIGAAMIEAAEQDGSLKSDSVVIEPTLETLELHLPLFVQPKAINVF